MYLIGKMFPLSVIHIIGEIFPFVKINFYLYIGRAQALIINKKDVDEGSVDELCALLRKGLKKRFREKKKLRKS